MAAFQRRTTKQRTGSRLSVSGIKERNKMPRIKSTRFYMLIGVVALILVLFPYSRLSQVHSEDEIMFKSMGFRMDPHLHTPITNIRLSEGVTMTTYFRESTLPEEVNLGTHYVVVSVQRRKCPFPKFSARFVGNSLVYLNMVEFGKTRTFSGKFNFPVPGTYTLETQFYGCKEKSISVNGKQGPEKNVSVKATGIPPAIIANEFSEPPFPVSHWIKQNQSETGTNEAYLWENSIGDANSIVKISNTSVLIESATTEKDGFYQFKNLGNYELLCFLGNKTMQDIRSQFLEIRSQIFSGQRPFKFHMYNMAGFFHRPDRYWTVSDKARIRKCKHILVNIEEFEKPLSQREYRDQLVTFVGHLLKLMNDTTFPIRLLTWTQPPVLASSCYSPILSRTTDHPCNDVLKSLFDYNNPTFPSRVKILDNTDITLPLMNEGKSSQALANIALRLFVVAGHQVSIWRASGQHGAIDGLHRNGTVEPNFVLIPYEDWN